MTRRQIQFDQVFTQLSHTNGVPLYSQVVHQIEDAIRRGIISVGDFLPPEPALCAGFGAARSTVRRAIGQLITKGVVTRKQGRGTEVVRQVTMDYSSATSVSLHADLRSAQRSPRSRVATCRSVVVDAALSKRTIFPIGTTVVELERVRLAGEIPIALMGNHLLASLVDFDLDRLVDTSLDELMRGKGHYTRTVEYEVSAALSTPRQAEMLEIETGTPLLCERRWAYTAGDNYINYSENYYHPTNFHFRGVLTE